MSVESPAVDAQDLLEEVRTTSLPDQVAELADEYERSVASVIGSSGSGHSLFPEFTLSSVHPDHADHVRTQKTILTMYVTMLDDIVENDGDRDTFEEARRLVQDPSAVDPSRAVGDEQLVYLDNAATTQTPKTYAC